jgi:2-methylcitrate dehydratase PrpD
VLTLVDRMRGEPQADAPPGWARITVRRRDGQTAAQETREHASGSPQLPLSQTQLEAKFRDCAANAVRPIPDDVIAQAIAQVLHLETAPDATILLRLFDPATGS